jgi:hypothetical protein
MTSAVLVVSYVLHFLCNPQKLNFNQVITDVRLFIFLSLILAFLTPVLQSLTVSSSDDTIILFVLIFSFFHLLLHDYTYVSLNNKPVKSKFVLTNYLADAIKDSPTIVSKDISYKGSPTSLNAIFFAAILLASRLTRISSVFVLLFQSLLIFGFGPYFRSELCNYNKTLYELLAVVTTALHFVMIFFVSKLMAVFYLLIAVFISFGGPLLFIYAYKFKK